MKANKLAAMSVAIICAGAFQPSFASDLKLGALEKLDKFDVLKDFSKGDDLKGVLKLGDLKKLSKGDTLKGLEKLDVLKDLAKSDGLKKDVKKLAAIVKLDKLKG